MSALDTQSVTHNASHDSDTDVTRNECRGCRDADDEATRREHVVGRVHCRNCHRDGHRECVGCGGCLGKLTWGRFRSQARLDQRYCSTTCRVNAHKYRTSDEGKAEAGERQRQYDEWAASPEARTLSETLKALSQMGGRLTPEQEEHRARIATAKATAEVCGDCGSRLYPSEAVYRAQYWHRDQVYPVCFDCRCRGHHHKGTYCERCRMTSAGWQKYAWRCPDAGLTIHPGFHKDDPVGPYCLLCHPTAYTEAPCEGCGRPVFNHLALRPAYRRVGRGQYASGHFQAAAVRTFCSDRCRRSAFAQEQRDKRSEREPIDCQVCGERIDAIRQDTRYCSPACKQRAYRARRASEAMA